MSSSVRHFLAEERISFFFIGLGLALLVPVFLSGFLFFGPIGAGFVIGGASYIVNRLRLTLKKAADLRELRFQLRQLPDSSLPVLDIVYKKADLFVSDDDFTRNGLAADSDREFVHLVGAHLVESRTLGARLWRTTSRWQRELVLAELNTELWRRERQLNKPAAPLGPRSRPSALSRTR